MNDEDRQKFEKEKERVRNDYSLEYASAMCGIGWGLTAAGVGMWASILITLGVLMLVNIIVSAIQNKK